MWYSVLKHYYSVWDIGNQRMGFAPNGQSRMSQEMNASHRLSSHRFLSGMRVLQTVVMIAMIVRIVKCYDHRTEAGSHASRLAYRRSAHSAKHMGLTEKMQAHVISACP